MSRREGPEDQPANDSGQSVDGQYQKAGRAPTCTMTGTQPASMACSMRLPAQWSAERVLAGSALVRGKLSFRQAVLARGAWQHWPQASGSRPALSAGPGSAASLTPAVPAPQQARGIAALVSGTLCRAARARERTAWVVSRCAAGPGASSPVRGKAKPGAPQALLVLAGRSLAVELQQAERRGKTATCRRHLGRHAGCRPAEA